jgi:ketosteroid isomerase-like protein
VAEQSTTPDLELTRGYFESMNRDWVLDALAGFFAPDAVWDLSDVGLGIYEGWAAIREFLGGWWANWEDHHHKIEEILDLGHGVVSVALWEDGRPIGTEARVQARRGWVVLWVEGKSVRWTAYSDIDKARAAAERLAEERGKDD